MSFTLNDLLADFAPCFFECVELVPIELLNGLLDLCLVFEHSLEISLELCFPLFNAKRKFESVTPTRQGVLLVDHVQDLRVNLLLHALL